MHFEKKENAFDTPRINARLLCPWDSPGNITGVGCHFLLQGIFLTQGSSLCLLYQKAALYHQCCLGSPRIETKILSTPTRPYKIRPSPPLLPRLIPPFSLRSAIQPHQFSWTCLTALHPRAFAHALPSAGALSLCVVSHAQSFQRELEYHLPGEQPLSQISW